MCARPSNGRKGAAAAVEATRGRDSVRVSVCERGCRGATPPLGRRLY